MHHPVHVTPWVLATEIAGSPGGADSPQLLQGVPSEPPVDNLPSQGLSRGYWVTTDTRGQSIG